MTITQRSNLIDVSFAVCTALDRVGTVAILTGGSAATYYAPDRYQSRDADFVITIQTNPGASASALENLGFTEQGGIHRHTHSRYTLDFPPGPLAVGAEIIRKYETVRRGEEVLNVLSRTDCVRDRLTAFYHWDDRSSLRTALVVATSGEIDFDKIARWSKSESSVDKFNEFARGYDRKLRPRPAPRI